MSVTSAPFPFSYANEQRESRYRLNETIDSNQSDEKRSLRSIAKNLEVSSQENWAMAWASRRPRRHSRGWTSLTLAAAMPNYSNNEWSRSAQHLSSFNTSPTRYWLFLRPASLFFICYSNLITRNRSISKCFLSGIPRKALHPHSKKPRHINQHLTVVYQLNQFVFHFCYALHHDQMMNFSNISGGHSAAAILCLYHFHQFLAVYRRIRWMDANQADANWKDRWTALVRLTALTKEQGSRVCVCVCVSVCNGV